MVDVLPPIQFASYYHTLNAHHVRESLSRFGDYFDDKPEAVVINIGTCHIGVHATIVHKNDSSRAIYKVNRVHFRASHKTLARAIGCDRILEDETYMGTRSAKQRARVGRRQALVVNLVNVLKARMRLIIDRAKRYTIET